MKELVKDFLVDPGAFDGPVLVTGAGGCIGAWTLAILKASGVPVVAFDLGDNRARPALVMGEEDARGLAWEMGDISDYMRLSQIVKDHGIRAIVHLAGLQVPFCAANPALGARVNVEGTINVLQAAREAQIKRTVYASSVAALGMPPGGPWRATLYGAYKQANEHTASVYWTDWTVPSIGLRPNVVYGLARDQGMSSKGTIAIQAAALGQPYEVPFSGHISWLYAGEAAAAFIACVSRDQEGAAVYDLNGACETMERGLEIIRSLAPGADLSAKGGPFPFPPDLDDGPLRANVPDYPSVPVEDGIRATYEAFVALQAAGRLPPLPA